MRISALGLVAVLAMALTGCAGDVEDVEERQPTPTVTPTASPTPTPTPTVAARPALSELVVYPGGIDYVKVGVAVEERPDDLAIVVYNPSGCVGEPNRIIGWESAYHSPSFNLVSNADGTIQGIAVVNDQIRTESGIHIGSPVADILAAYGEAVTVTQAQVNDLYSVTGPGGVLVFEVATDRDFEGGDYAARAGTVLWMLLLGPGTTPFSIAYGAYGSCV